MNNVLTTLLTTLFFALLGNIACANYNENCAMMIDEPNDPDEFAEVLGKKIYFCCGVCVKAFKNQTAYYIKALPSLAKFFNDEEKKKLGVDKVKLLSQRFCPVFTKRIVNPDSTFVEYKGKKIYLWSFSALRRWNSDPDKYFKEAMDRGDLPQYK